MSKRRLRNVLCLLGMLLTQDVFITSCGRLLYVVNVQKMSQKRIVFAGNVVDTKRLYYVLWTSFVRCECLKDVSETYCVCWECC